MRSSNVDSSLDYSNLVPNLPLVFLSNAAVVFPSILLVRVYTFSRLNL